MSTETLSDLRADFDKHLKGPLSMPLAGIIVWLAIAILGTVLSLRGGVLALIIATGAIFPIAMAIAKLRGEELLYNANPLARLMGVCILMVNLLWALHIPLFINAPQFVPLSLGIGLGLHWMVYSWIIGHPLGYQHAIVRTIGLTIVWFAFPSHVVTASALVVVAAYVVTLLQMRTRLSANPSFNGDVAKAMHG